MSTVNQLSPKICADKNQFGRESTRMDANSKKLKTKMKKIVLVRVGLAKGQDLRAKDCCYFTVIVLGDLYTFPLLSQA